jgi:hypothetical protein
MDEASRVLIASVSMTGDQFAKAVTGAYMSDVPVEYGNMELVGKKLETKTELLPLAHADFRNPYSPTDEELAAFLAPYEVDGWIGSRDDVMNYHRRVGDSVNVLFRRHV